MLSQLKDLILTCLLVLLVAGFVSGVVNTGYLLGLLILACLFSLLVPNSLKPSFKILGTLSAGAVMLCVFSRLLSSIRIPDDFPQAVALLLVSFGAYILWKIRHRKPERTPRLSGAERTPVLPGEIQEP